MLTMGGNNTADTEISHNTEYKTYSHTDDCDKGWSTRVGNCCPYKVPYPSKNINTTLSGVRRITWNAYLRAVQTETVWFGQTPDGKVRGETPAGDTERERESVHTGLADKYET